MNTPELSIIIPTLNEEAYLPKLLSCLQNQTFKDFEIIVADAGSKDSTREIARNAHATVVEGGFPGEGRNRGAEVSNAELIMFIDADVQFDTDFIEKAVQDFKKRNLDFAIPFMYTKHDKLKFRLFLQWNNAYKRIMRYTRFPDGTGQLVLVKKDCFIKIGQFPDFKVAEDTDLFWRAARKKYKVGTINQRFHSSTRRLEKIGLFWTFTAFGFVGFFLFFGLAGNKRVQNVAARLYGGSGKKD